MKYILSILLLSVVCSTLALVPVPADRRASGSTTGPAIPPPPPPPPTLSQDLAEIMLSINFRPIRELVNRYLLNDSQFQTLVRVLNSNDAHIALMRLRTEPEIINLMMWVHNQLTLSGNGEFEYEEFGEIFLFNTSPFWSSSVFGLQGFIRELTARISHETITAQIQLKLSQRGSLFLFYQRLQNLLPVYERFLKYPETQRMIATLTAAGINMREVDTSIRTMLGWPLPVVLSTTAQPNTAPAEASTAAPAATAAPASASAAASVPTVAAAA